MALNGLYCADVQLSNYSLTHSLTLLYPNIAVSTYYEYCKKYAEMYVKRNCLLHSNSGMKDRPPKMIHIVRFFVVDRLPECRQCYMKGVTEKQTVCAMALVRFVDNPHALADTATYALSQTNRQN